MVHGSSVLPISCLYPLLFFLLLLLTPPPPPSKHASLFLLIVRFRPDQHATARRPAATPPIGKSSEAAPAAAAGAGRLTVRAAAVPTSPPDGVVWSHSFREKPSRFARHFSPTRAFGCTDFSIKQITACYERLSVIIHPSSQRESSAECSRSATPNSSYGGS